MGNKKGSVLLCYGILRQDLNCLKFYVNFDSAYRPVHSFAPPKENIFGHMLFVETGHVD